MTSDAGTHTQISSETGSDTGTKSADVSSISDSEVQSTEKGIGDPKRHKLEGTEATKESNEIKYASEVQDSQLSREGEETIGFHSENTDRTEVHFRPVEVETKSYFSIRKGSGNINDSPYDHGHRKCDVTVTEYETSNNGIFPSKALNNMNSNIYNTSSVLSTDDCMTSTAFQTTLGTSGAISSQETEKASWDNSSPVLNGTKTVATVGGTVKTQEKGGEDNPNSNSKSTEKDRDNTKRITFILFLITLVYFCSFLPHLILKILAFLKKDFLFSLNFSGAFAYNTFVWSFFINNVANPFIYGFYDKRFKSEVKLFYHRGMVHLSRLWK